MKSRSLSLKTRALAFALTLILPLGLSLAKETKSVVKKATPQKNVKKKTPVPPVSKKNLKKGKNTDTAKKVSPKKKIVTAPIKPRPALPTQTRAEMLKLKAVEEAKVASETVPAEATTASTDTAATTQTSEEAAPDAPISDADLNAGSEEVALDLGAETKDSWNPYTFGRSSFWFLLPLLSLIIIGLHLLPVPKRIYPKRLSAVPDFLQLKDKTRNISRPKKQSGESSNG